MLLSRELHNYNMNERPMKILINVINARNIGGGFQVVFNFILKTQEYTRPDVEWYYAVSDRLDGYLS